MTKHGSPTKKRKKIQTEDIQKLNPVKDVKITADDMNPVKESEVNKADIHDGSSVTLAGRRVVEAQNLLKDSLQGLKIAEEQARSYESLAQKVDNLKKKIKDQSIEIESLKKDPVKSIILELKNKHAGLLHDHLLGNETLHDEDVEEIYNLLGKL